MKKTSIFYIILFSPLFLFCQGNTSIDVVAGKGLTFIHGDSNVGTLFQLGSDNFTRGASGWRAGLHINKKLGESTYLRLGVKYAHLRLKSDLLTDLMWGSEHDGMGGWAGPDPSLPHSIQFFSEFWFLEIPILFRHEFFDSKFTPFVEGGLSPYVYIKSQEIRNTDLGIIIGEFDEDFSPVHFVFQFSVGVNYALSEKTDIVLQPSFRYHLTSIERISGQAENLYNFGLELGFRQMIGSAK